MITDSNPRRQVPGLIPDSDLLYSSIRHKPSPGHSCGSRSMQLYVSAEDVVNIKITINGRIRNDLVLLCLGIGAMSKRQRLSVETPAGIVGVSRSYVGGVQSTETSELLRKGENDKPVPQSCLCFWLRITRSLCNGSEVGNCW